MQVVTVSVYFPGPAVEQLHQLVQLRLQYYLRAAVGGPAFRRAVCGHGFVRAAPAGHQLGGRYPVFIYQHMRYRCGPRRAQRPVVGIYSVVYRQAVSVAFHIYIYVPRWYSARWLPWPALLCLSGSPLRCRWGKAAPPACLYIPSRFCGLSSARCC